MISVKRRLLGTLGVVLVLAGCGGGVNVYMIDAKAKTTDLTISNSSLQSDCEIVSGKALYQEQLMQAFVSLQSHTNDSQKLYYKFNWYDSDGVLMGEEGWTFLALKGNEPYQARGTATGPRAQRCEFMIRRRSKDDHEN